MPQSRLSTVVVIAVEPACRRFAGLRGKSGDCSGQPRLGRRNAAEAGVAARYPVPLVGAPMDRKGWTAQSDKL
jgi:hypothetical protein